MAEEPSAQKGPQLSLFVAEPTPSKPPEPPLASTPAMRQAGNKRAQAAPNPQLRGPEPGSDLAGDGRPACLTVLGAARYLSISRAKVYELLAERVLRSFTIGRSRRIPLAELDRFIAERLEDG